MNKRAATTLIVLALIVVGGLVILATVKATTLIVITLVGWSAVVVVAAIVTNAMTRQSSAAPQQSSPTPPNPAEELETALNGLANLNLDLRLAGITGSLMERIEALIDRLQVILPRLYAEFEGFPLTRETGRIATENLPELCLLYAKFSPADRQAKQGDFNDRLGAMEKAVASIEKAANEKDMVEFTVMVEFQKFKF